MKIFISSETDLMNGLTDLDSNKKRVTINKFESLINCLLGKNNYGDAISEENSIGIVMTIYSKKFLQDIVNQTGKEFVEKKIYRAKTKDSDIRLRIDYKRYLRSNEEIREKLILKNILESILVLNDKVKKHKDITFFGEKLVEDICHLLKVKKEEILNI